MIEAIKRLFRPTRFEFKRFPIENLKEIIHLHAAFYEEHNRFWRDGDRIVSGDFTGAVNEMIAYLQNPSEGTQTACFACLADGKVVGFASGDVWNKRTRVMDLYVIPKHRGKGIATRLIRECMAWGKSAGAERAEISVYEKNNRAETLYKTLGFVPYFKTLTMTL